jgi:enterochelin esterase-like enzyme
MAINKAVVAAAMLASAGVFAEEVKWPVPPAGFNQASASIPKGTVSARTTYTTRNAGSRVCKVYTPPGYSETRAEKYPVLYLHHGIGGNENAWTAAQTDGQEGNADKIMDYLYSKTDMKVTPMIVVMPFANMEGVSGDTWQAFEDVEMNDLAPFIQSKYNASADPSMRAIAGLSMGAGQSLNFGYKNPTFYNWIGTFSPAPNTIAAGTTMNTPAKIAAVKANIKLAYLAAGTSEQNPYLTNARAYHTFLQTNGVSPLYLQVEDGLAHEPKNWNRQLYNFAQRIFKGTTTGIIQMPKERSASRAVYRSNVPGQAMQFWFGLNQTEQVSLDGRIVPMRSKGNLLEATKLP